MIFVLTPATVANPSVLDTQTVPRRLLELGLIAYPRSFRSRLFWRVFFERSLPRYVVALSPFPLLILAKPEWALGLSQAPVLMFGVVLWIETYVLSISDPAKRKALVDKADAERTRDALRARGMAVLEKIAGHRGLASGELHLVIEQSGLHRVAPLTLVSVQGTLGKAGFLDLDETERGWLKRDLFGEGLDERKLHLVSLAANEYLHVITLDASTISAHARLQALAGR